MTHRSGRPVRPARHPRGAVHVRLDQLAPARRRAVRGPRRRRRRRRQHHPGLDRAGPRPDLPQGARGRRAPARSRSSSAATTRSPGRARPPSPRSVGRAASGSSISTPTPTRPTDDWGVLAGHGTPMRRLIESGAVKGRNFVQVGLRGYWPPVETFEWMKAAGPPLALHARDRGARRRGRHRPGDRRGARRARLRLPQPRHRRHRPGPGARHRARPNPAGCSPARCCGRSARSWRAVDLAGMDIVEVSPPYDHAETTSMTANRAALEAISALAVRRAAGKPVRWAGRELPADRFPAGPPIITDTRADRADVRSPIRDRRRAGPPVRPRPRRRSRATSTCTSRWPTAPTARSSSSPSAAGGWRCRSPRPATR